MRLKFESKGSALSEENSSTPRRKPFSTTENPTERVRPAFCPWIVRYSIDNLLVTSRSYNSVALRNARKRCASLKCHTGFGRYRDGLVSSERKKRPTGHPICGQISSTQI